MDFNYQMNGMFYKCIPNCKRHTKEAITVKIENGFDMVEFSK